jgi:hypothetical protein
VTEQAPGGWAQGGHEQPRGPFAAEMPVRRGVFISDMPSARPVHARPKIKGVAGATATTDEDHLPGGGTWRPVN